MNTALRLSKNTFLSPQEQQKRSHAYYGEFFAVKNFDDGWEQNLYNKVLQYLQTILDGEISIQVYDDLDTTHEKLNIILSVWELSQEVSDSLLEITTRLQRDYLCTPTVQNINYTWDADISLPVELSDISESDTWYHRFQLQSHIAQILTLRNETVRLEYMITQFSNASDSVMSQIVQDCKASLKALQANLKDLEQTTDELIAQYYLEISTKSFGSNVVHQISPIQADAVIDLGDNDNSQKWYKILEWMKSMEQLVESNAQSTIDAQNTITEFKTQMSDMISVFTGVEVWQSEYGVIKSPKYDGQRSRYVTEWINMTTWKKFYLLNDCFTWFKLPGIDIIRTIKWLTSTPHEILTTIEVNDKYTYYLEDWKYHLLEIQWVSNLKKVYSLDFTKETSVLCWGLYEDWLGHNNYFYRDWNSFKCLVLNWVWVIGDIQKWWIYESRSWWSSNFITKMMGDKISFWKYKTQQDIVSEVDEENEWWKLFILDQWVYKTLKIHGHGLLYWVDWSGNQPSSFAIDKNKVPSVWYFKDEKGVKKVFQKTNNWYEELELENLEEPYTIIDMNINSDSKVSHWVYKTHGDICNSGIFFLQDGKYKSFNVSWCSDITYCWDLTLDGGTLIWGNIRMGSKERVFIYQNNEYKVLELDEYKFNIASLNHFWVDNGIVCYGVGHNSQYDRIIFVRTNQGGYKQLQIRWVKHLNEISELSFENGVIVSWKYSNKWGWWWAFFLDKNTYKKRTIFNSRK